MPKFYVDDIYRTYGTWRFVHLGTDGSEEDLIVFARGLGLNPEWIQKTGTPYVHFDITAGKRAAALIAGAVSVSAKDFVRFVALPKKPRIEDEK
jgi:hypothetical protein